MSPNIKSIFSNLNPKSKMTESMTANVSFTFQNSQLLIDALFNKGHEPKRVITIYDPDDSVTVDVICKEKTVTLHHLQNQNVYRTSVMIDGKEERFFFSKPENLKRDFEKNLN